MDCFKHAGHVAVAICRFCQKGLCLDCSSQLTQEHGCICSRECLQKMEQIDQLNAMAAESWKRNSSTYLNVGIVQKLFSLFFIVMGGFFLAHNFNISTPLILGSIFIVFGVLYLLFTHWPRSKN